MEEERALKEDWKWARGEQCLSRWVGCRGQHLRRGKVEWRRGRDEEDFLVVGSRGIGEMRMKCYAARHGETWSGGACLA